MIRLSIDLPTRRRLHLRLVRRRKGLKEESLFPSLGKIRRAKKGNKLSRFFRHIFENRRIKKVLGTNLALIIIASSLFSVRAEAGVEPEKIVISEEETPLTTKKGIQYPVFDVKISQGYKFFHPGVDFDGKTGEAISPIMGGKVKNISYSRFGYGNAVIVNHGNGITSLYGHLSEIIVSEGENVTTETKLGEMGATGQSFGDHLHLEIRERGRAINPLTLLSR